MGKQVLARLRRKANLCAVGGNADGCSHGGKRYGVASLLYGGNIVEKVPCDPEILFLGLCPMRPKTLIQKNMRTPMLIAAQVSVSSEWIRELGCTHTMVQYSAVEKKGIVPFVTMWMGLEIIMLSGISQPEKENTIESVLYVEHNEHDQLMNKIETEAGHMEQTDSCRRGGVLRSWVKNKQTNKLINPNSMVIPRGKGG